MNIYSSKIRKLSMNHISYSKSNEAFIKRNWNKMWSSVSTAYVSVNVIKDECYF